MTKAIDTLLRRIALAAMAAGAVSANPASAAASKTLGIETIASLSAGDLDVGSGRGNAALRRLFPTGENACSKPENLPFGRMCAWYPDPDGDAPWPGLFLAIDHGRIVSIVAPDVSRLDSKVWACDASGGEDGVTICHVHTVPPELRLRWSAAWQQFLNAAN